MARITASKLWPGTNCAILETIERDYEFVDAQIHTHYGVAWLSIAGANVTGRAWAGSMIGVGTQHVTVEGRGEERHSYRLIAEPGCTVTDCQIRVKGRAQGQMAGILEDSDMHVQGTGSFRILGSQFPFRFRVDPKPSPGEEQGEATLDVRINPDTADIDGKITYTWKKVVGDSDTWEGPDYEEEEIQTCDSGLVELSAHTTITLQAYNDDWNADSCYVNADMTCEIRTLQVTVACTCDSEVPKSRAGTITDRAADKAAIDEQGRRIGERLEGLKQALRGLGPEREPPPRATVDRFAGKALARTGESGIGGAHMKALRAAAAEIDDGANGAYLGSIAERVARERQQSVLYHAIDLCEVALGDIAAGYRLSEQSLALVLGSDRAPQRGRRS